MDTAEPQRIAATPPTHISVDVSRRSVRAPFCFENDRNHFMPRLAAEWTGAGIGTPGLKASQSMALSFSGSARSTCKKSSSIEAFAKGPSAGFTASRSTVSGLAEYVHIVGFAWNKRYIGVDSRSYWLMGGSFKISSIVRTMEVIVHGVWSTNSCLT